MIDKYLLRPSIERPHFLLLGAGASKAALPNGDKYGRQLPLLQEVAAELNLTTSFPADLQRLASEDFEAAYSRLSQRGDVVLSKIESAVRDYFASLVLPDAPNLYDVMQLSLRKKDVIFTFNWDPLLVESRHRLVTLGGVSAAFLPQLFFLHGNVGVGYCDTDRISGYDGMSCSKCDRPLSPTPLLFPVEKKNYQDESFIEREWRAAREFLKRAFMFTVFGYSAPTTDVEAINLLKEGWGEVTTRQFEETELINKPGCDHEALQTTWNSFIHTHHYVVWDTFYDSWLSKYPRRTGELWWGRYIESQWINDHPLPAYFPTIVELVDWFHPLLENEL